MTSKPFRTTLFALLLLVAAGGGLAAIDPAGAVPTEGAGEAAATAADARPEAAPPATAAPAPLFLDNPPATCHADCLYGPDVSCSGNTCSSADDPGGYVICDGKPKLCPRPPL